MDMGMAIAYAVTDFGLTGNLKKAGQFVFGITQEAFSGLGAIGDLCIFCMKGDYLN